MTRMQVAVHPGEVLRELYLAPLEMSTGTLARRTGVPRTRMERLCREEVGLSVDTAFRLARFFGTTPDYWANLQKNYELIKGAEEIDVSDITPLEIA
ncbi:MULTISPECIES: HigA family addiction module antitoxin [unclassified Roseivivax]|uniref:HigA family addiction module antitoxin n=1 Tax=Roseivivax sp. GX 12232 TaxID=2900547 RepID=UPI001E492262|nr:HigA family addiction module antitoxin [Roseivivax sp. GX 12232]MCE0505317.1 HigA family addiction module antitoxin [Roseivivax sp. GX 12232]